MIQLTPQMRILLAVKPVDFRSGIDGLAKICRTHLADPFCGTVFVFRNRKQTAIKALMYDGQGFWLFHKRLSKGKFRYWPKQDEPLNEIEAHQLSVLLMGGNPDAVSSSGFWRKIKPNNSATFCNVPMKDHPAMSG
jgi:transposase